MIINRSILILFGLLAVFTLLPFANAENITAKDNGLVEIFDSEDVITIPDDSAYNKFREDILSGLPIKYYSFNYNNKRFEWLVPKNKYTLSFKENAVLLITYKNNKTQVIKVKAEGGQGIPVAAEDKFFFADVNFDGKQDLLVHSGSFGAQEALKYYCFIRTKNRYKEIPTFTEILNPVIDKNDKVIKSEWRNSANSYGSAIYRYKRGKFVIAK